MSSSNNLIAGLLLAPALCLGGCSNPSFESLQGDPIADHLRLQDTAAFLCQYSRGSFPNWAQWPHYQQFLSESEKSAISSVSQILIQQAKNSPKYLAISSFIAQNTACTPTIVNGIALVEKDQSGASRFTFKQQFPGVPNIPELSFPDSMSPDEQYQAYLKAFQNAWTGDLYEREISITLTTDENNRIILRSAIQSSFADPLVEMDFWKEIDRFHLTNASEILTVICSQNEHLCRKLRPFMRAAHEFRAHQAQNFNRDVIVSDSKLTSIAITPTASYSALSLTLTNSGSNTYQNIVFITDEDDPQYCILQSERSKKSDHPLTLMPGQTTQAWCALNGKTKPWTGASFWISD